MEARKLCPPELTICVMYHYKRKVLAYNYWRKKEQYKISGRKENSRLTKRKRFYGGLKTYKIPKILSSFLPISSNLSNL